MNNYKMHQKLLKQCLKALQKMFPEARFFERHVGLFYTIKNNPIKINKKGMADVYGIINGMHIEIELKLEKQYNLSFKKLQKTVENAGGKYFLIRSIDCLKQLEYLQV